MEGIPPAGVASGHNNSRPDPAACAIGVSLRDVDRMHRAGRFARIELNGHAERLQALWREPQTQLVPASERMAVEAQQFFNNLLRLVYDLA